MFNNKNMRGAIENLHGKDTYHLITETLKRIANRGTKTPGRAKLVNFFNNVFIKNSYNYII